MNALLIRPGEKIEEKEIDFTPEFFKDYFGEVVTGTIFVSYLNLQIHFLLEPTIEKPNFTLWDMTFHGNVLIVGGKPDGTPCSVNYEDASFIKRYIKSYSKPQPRTRIKEIKTICDW